MKLNLTTLALTALTLAIFLRYASTPSWTPTRILGAAIAAVALALLVTARIQLGRAFSLRAKASTLVTGGLYSRIRNPIYVFGALLVFGMYIWSGYRWWLLLALVALIALQTVRSRRESQILEENFGAAYTEYKKKTWF